MNWFEHWLRRVMPATPHERAAALWSFAYFFALLAGYYVLRPLRDQMGIAGGVKNLPWLFTATFITLLVAQPLYGALVARLSRSRFIPIVYHFFVANLLLFWVLLTFDIETVHVARIFFVWVSVFNLFAVAVFWSFMADLFTSEQGKRLFGFIGAGGTAGALLGPVITIWLSVPLGPVNLMIAAAVFLEVAVFCVYRLERAAVVHTGPNAATENIGGSAFAAIPALVRSPYMMGVATWVALLSYAATIIYFEQAHIVSEAVKSAGLQTRIFASIDLAVSVLTLLTQLLLTGHLLKRLGTGVAAAALPAVYIAGFAVLAVMPTLIVVVTIQVLQRWMNFAIANPARQLFFTVVTREEKYKAKNLVDVVVYRGSDAL
ncbi:MAG: MFS transporter, partial [Pseudolabrys sp.]